MQPNFNDEGFYNVVRNKYFLECVVLVSCVMFVNIFMYFGNSSQTIKIVQVFKIEHSSM